MRHFFYDERYSKLKLLKKIGTEIVLPGTIHLMLNIFKDFKKRGHRNALRDNSSRDNYSQGQLFSRQFSHEERKIIKITKIYSNLKLLKKSCNGNCPCRYNSFGDKHFLKNSRKGVTEMLHGTIFL